MAIKKKLKNNPQKTNNKISSKEYYNSLSKGYEELHKDEQLKKIKLIKDKINKTNFINITPSTTLLDVGCGTGLTTNWNCKCIGIDPAEKLLEIAKNNYHNIKSIIKFINAKAESIPFKDNHFDIVISITAIQNFTNIKKALTEIKRVGKNHFILTFLKKSPKKEIIKKVIKSLFKIKNEIEEQKDIIFFCKNL